MGHNTPISHSTIKSIGLQIIEKTHGCWPTNNIYLCNLGIAPQILAGLIGTSQFNNRIWISQGGTAPPTPNLTLKCIRYPALPLVHNGGFHGTPQRKPLSHRNFLIIFTPYVYTLITTIFQGKKYKIFVPFQNGGQITDFHFATFRFRPKFEKPLSQRNFSMKFGSN